MKKKMTQEQRLDTLVEAFKADSVQYKDLQTPADTEGKRRILRSLMNIRMPKKLDDSVLTVQDEYLRERVLENGIVTLSEIPVIRNGMSIWQGDITRLAVDAIVNAANSQMLGCFVPMHTCIDNCIHTFAGVQLRAECSRQMNQLRIKYGKDYEQPTAVPMLTDAYNLPAKKVIHIVGPIVQYELTPELEMDLADCYLNTLDMCLDNNLRSVAFCCISTGVFHFPNKRAAQIAVSTVDSWLSQHPGAMERVIFNVFKDEDKNTMKNLYDEMPNGYQESIQKGLSAVRYFSRNMSFGTVSREEQIDRLKQEIKAADAIVIGAGAGLSTSAGLTYSGERFERYFFDFARKYGIRDMYSGGFYPSLMKKHAGHGGQGISTTTDILMRRSLSIRNCSHL